MTYIISSVLAIKLKKRIEETVPISIVSMILIVYVFGLFNNLALGVIVLEIIATISAIYFIKLIVQNVKNKNGKELTQNLLTPGILIYVILIVISIIANKNRVLELYDTFNHWGLVVKNMFITNNYGTTGNIISYNEYPPFTGTFQYILLKLRGQYVEDTMITGQCILYFSMILPILKNIKWDKSLIKLLIVVPMVVVLPIIFFDNFYTEILVDGFIGVMVALSMYQVYKKEDDIYSKILLITYLTALTLTKNIGILLTIAVIIVDIIIKISNKKELKQGLKSELKQIGILTAIILVICGSWYTKVAIDHANLNWGNPKAVYKDQQEKNEIIQQFFNEIVNNNKEITERDLSALMCLMIYISLTILLYNKSKEKNKLIIQIAMTIIMIIYILLMMIPYLTLFEKEETMMLSCFNRYISSILLSGFFLNMLIAFENLKSRHIIYVITILILFLPFETIGHRYINASNYNDMVMYKRDKYGYIKHYNKIFKPEDKIYLVAEEIFDKYYTTQINQYEVLPAKIGNSDFTETPANIVDQLKREYTYIYVLNGNKQFSNLTKEIFKEDISYQENALYKIIKQEDQIKLERMLLKEIL